MGRSKKKIPYINSCLSVLAEQAVYVAFGTSKPGRIIGRIALAAIDTYLNPYGHIQVQKQLNQKPKKPAKNPLYAGRKKIVLENGVEYYPPRKGS